MKIIYAHGLDSSSNSVKGQILEQYCQHHHSNISVIRPDLNESPDKVFRRLCHFVQEYNVDNEKTQDVVLIGSSLGGYFSTLVSNVTGCPAVLLNPSTQPHISLQRFVNKVDDHFTGSKNMSNKQNDTVIYRTTGGWALTLEDMAWFNEHKLDSIRYPNKILAIIKSGDELLDPSVAIDFYQSQGVKVNIQQGGDHRMTDFKKQLPMVITYLNSLLR